MAENTGWTDEMKANLVADYEAMNPTPETTTEIVKTLAEDYGKTVNGVRMILIKANSYVKTQEAPKAAKGSSSSSGAKRVNKAEALDALRSAITNAGHEVDEEIVSKLTGKAAVYLTGMIGK